MENLRAAVETYLTDMHRRHATGATTVEASFYGPLENLLNTIGATLKPKVLCVGQLGNIGGGQPDFGLFTAKQLQHGQPRDGAVPERGVIEVKPLDEEILRVAATPQVSKYWSRYRLVLVTNYREFLLVGEDAQGRPVRLEGFSLASSEGAFWEAAATPRVTAGKLGRSFGEYLIRALTQNVSLGEPKDVAWFLASYARDALGRVEDKGGLPALKQVRQALEAALGISFEGRKGDHFFHSTLVQTLFYGVFSAWVLWSRDHAHHGNRFDWRLASWYLKVPMLSALFGQLAQPNRLGPLDLVEVLDWAAGTLNRVARDVFFAKFEETHAVQYFYEPFLAAFDPELRKELGVWYTPIEVVQYMVQRVDRSLRDDLGVADGLADERVHVLDPCCGTGSYLAEVLRRIDRTLADRGLGALKGHKVKEAVLKRVHGFEIMPAPFVVSHLQIGLLLQGLQAPLAQDGSERASVYLTNALTGWSDGAERQIEAFPEFATERELAAEVKREEPILVVVGNPPYNGYAGMAMAEEQELTRAYRTTRRVRRPEGQGLNDLYVRFFRMAERRIVEMTGRGVVCFISNYSWLDGLSFTGMRERYLEVFGAIRIDCLNGDKYKTGKVTPEGEPDPSIFSSSQNPVGIQVGTAITLLVRSNGPTPPAQVGFRNLWGRTKRQQLIETADEPPEALYETLDPPLELGLPFVHSAVSPHYFDWPSLPDLFPTSFPGVKTSRDDFLVAIDRDVLWRRLEKYFDPAVSHEEMRRIAPSVMTDTQRFKAEAVRDQLRKRGFLPENVVRYAYRPFDIRWLYWEPETKLLDEKRSEYWPHIFDGNRAIVTQQKPRREWSKPQVIRHLGCLDLMDRSATCIPMHLTENVSTKGEVTPTPRANLSGSSHRYVEQLHASVQSLMFHVLTTLHTPMYEQSNSGALRMDWPRIPLPRNVDLLERLTGTGAVLSELLDSEAPVDGVTAGQIRPELRGVALVTSTDTGSLKDMSLSVGWGYDTGITMPGQGKLAERAYRKEEREAMAGGAEALKVAPAEVFRLLGETTFD
ncbi:MAG: type ISP restriction/modification enzyme, partial [Gammaproteobacteria bacterium]